MLLGLFSKRKAPRPVRTTVGFLARWWGGVDGNAFCVTNSHREKWVLIITSPSDASSSGTNA